MSDALDVVAYALLAQWIAASTLTMSFISGRCAWLGHSVRTHSLVVGSWPPCHTSWPLDKLYIFHRHNLRDNRRHKVF